MGHLYLQSWIAEFITVNSIDTAIRFSYAFGSITHDMNSQKKTLALLFTSTSANCLLLSLTHSAICQLLLYCCTEGEQIQHSAKPIKSTKDKLWELIALRVT